MKRKGEDSIQNILKSYVKQKPIQKGYTEADFRKFWSEQMGEMINKYTKSVRLRNQIASIEISSIALRTELQFSKTKLLQLLQDEFGVEKVKDIRIL